MTTIPDDHWACSWSDADRALAISIPPVGRRGSFGPLVGGACFTLMLAVPSLIAFISAPFETSSFIWLALSLVAGSFFISTARNALRVGFGATELHFTDTTCTVTDRVARWKRRRVIHLTSGTQLLAGPVASSERGSTPEKSVKGIALYLDPHVHWLARQLEGEDAETLRRTILRHFPRLTPRTPSETEQPPKSTGPSPVRTSPPPSE
jgi:hypothetical protein